MVNKLTFGRAVPFYSSPAAFVKKWYFECHSYYYEIFFTVHKCDLSCVQADWALWQTKITPAAKRGRCMKNPRSSLFLISLTFCCRWRQLQGYRCSASTTDKFKATAVKLEAGGVKDAELALRAWRICVCALNTCRRALRILRNERANKTPRGSFCFHGMFGDITFCVT